MVEFLVSKLHDVRFMTMLLAAIAASATVYTLVMPLFAGMVAPVVLFVGSVVYVFLIAHMEKSMPIKIGICVGAAYLGLQAPMLFLKNAISKRQLSIKRAFPDALDLLLICIESGMSVEVAFRKVSLEIGSQSPALAEEFSLTTAELSYLQDRKV